MHRDGFGALGLKDCFRRTVDGCEILHQLIGGKHPIILDGFQPSFWTFLVVQDFFHSSMMFNAELLDTVVIPTQWFQFSLTNFCLAPIVQK
jgi:hypothetical protein